MSDDAAPTECRWRVRVSVQHAAVLDRGRLADGDLAVVAPEHRRWPDARVRTELHCADDYRVRMDEGRRGNLGNERPEGIYRHGSEQPVGGQLLHRGHLLEREVPTVGSELLLPLVADDLGLLAVPFDHLGLPVGVRPATAEADDRTGL